MSRIYNYLDIPYFQHNFDFIEQVTQEDDKIHGIDDFHTIRNELNMLPSDAKQILGNDICDWIYNHYRWFYNYFRYQK
jgi:hypothetical protein